MHFQWGTFHEIYLILKKTKQEGNVLQNLRQQWFKGTFMNVFIAPMFLLILLSQKLSESPRIPKLSSATLVALFQPINRYCRCYMVIFPKLFQNFQIFPKLSWNTLVPLFQPKSRYYMIISPKLSSDTLGVPSDLTGQFGQIG